MVKNTKLNRFIARILPWRLWVQAGFLLVWLGPFGLRLHNICGPVFHCYACPLATFACPIGIMAQFSAIHVIPFLAIGTVLAVGALFGALICGWICPFGLLQDLGAKVPIKKFHLPAWTGWFRYVVLIGAVFAIPWLFGEGHPLFVCRICPAGAIEKAIPDVITHAAAGKEIVWPNAVKITIVVTMIVAMFITIRPWCRVLCPLGAIFGFLNRFSILSMRLEDAKCNACKRCRTLCVYGGAPDKDANHDACFRCFECTRCGPGALGVTTVFESSPPPDEPAPPENPEA
jgi:polyferredoxin